MKWKLLHSRKNNSGSTMDQINAWCCSEVNDLAPGMNLSKGCSLARLYFPWISRMLYQWVDPWHQSREWECTGS